MAIEGFFALQTGRVDDDGDPATLTVHALGDLAVPSGRLHACDPYVTLGDDAEVPVEPGTYPVLVTVADVSDEQDGSHLREAYLSLVLAEGDPAQVEVLRGPEGRVLGIGVEAGTVAFADAAAAAGAEAAFEADDTLRDAVVEQWFAAQDAEGPEPEGCANVQLPGATAGESLVLSHSGWGDGWYPLAVTRAEDGALLGVHIVLDVVGWVEGWERDEDQDWEQAEYAAATEMVTDVAEPDLAVFRGLRPGPVDGTTLAVRDLGELHLPTGELVFWAPGADPSDTDTAQVEPGSYPVRATVQLDDQGDELATWYLSLVVAEGDPAELVQACSVHGTPTQLPVGRRLVALADRGALRDALPADPATWYGDVVAGGPSPWLDAVFGDPTQPEGFAVLPLGDGPANVVLADVTSDGPRPVLVTLDEDGDLLAFHVVCSPADGVATEPLALTRDRLLSGFLWQMLNAFVTEGTPVGGWCSVFRAFAQRPVADAASDEVEARFGPADDAFTLSLTRRAAGADGVTGMVSSTLSWQLTDELRALGSGVVSSGEHRSLDEFWTAAAALPGFAWALPQEGDPDGSRISYDLS